MSGSRKFCQRESNFDSICLVDEVREDPNTTKDGPMMMARQRNNDDSPTLNADLVALLIFRSSGPVLLRNPNFLWFFRGGESGPPVPPPSLNPCMQNLYFLLGSNVVYLCHFLIIFACCF